MQHAEQLEPPGFNSCGTCSIYATADAALSFNLPFIFFLSFTPRCARPSDPEPHTEDKARGTIEQQSVTAGAGRNKVSDIRGWQRANHLHPGVVEANSVTSEVG